MRNIRITFLVDGFNVYHSARAADEQLGRPATKWLDLRSLLSSYLHHFGRDATLRQVYYFSALAAHMDSRRPGTTTRHRLYIDCLKATGVQIELGRFKEKDGRCPVCQSDFSQNEEKETDVAISARLLELFHTDACDAAILVTGDTDLTPAVKTAFRLFPTKKVCFAFPFKRKTAELAKLAPDSFRMSLKQYLRHQLPDPFTLPSGREVRKPPTW